MFRLARPSRGFTLAMLIGIAATSFGQEPADIDPFGGGEKPAAEPAAGKPLSIKKSAEEVVETDFFVVDLRRTNPSTPAQLLRAAQLMTDYGRIDEATKYIERLAESNPDATVLVELQRKSGSAIFIRWIRDQRFGSTVSEFSRQVLEAASQAAENPERLQELIQRLSDANVQVRHAALVDLRDAGVSAVAPMLRVLADRGRSNDHRYVKAALVRLGQTMVAPLIGALDTLDVDQKAQVIEVLGRLHAPHATWYLVRPAIASDTPQAISSAARNALIQIVDEVPTKAEAEQYLYRQANALFNGEPVAESDYEDLVTVWHWDQAQQASVPAKLSSRRAPRSAESPAHRRWGR